MSVTEKDKTEEPSKEIAEAQPSSWIDEWFDHWPFANRWASLLPRPSGVEPARVEQYTDGDELVIRAEMPGIEDEKNIDVSITGDKLTVSAHREQRSESRENGTFRSEFHYGSFKRTVTVPPGTDTDDISASYKDGILEVRVKTDADTSETKKVAVERP